MKNKELKAENPNNSGNSIKPVLAAVDVAKLGFEQVEYWCPAEVLEALQAELKGEKYKYKEPNSIHGGHYFYFCCTKDGKYNIVSGLDMKAWLLRNVYESQLDSVNHNPKITPLAGLCIKAYLNGS